MAIKGLDQAIDNLSRVRKNAIPAASAMTINRVATTAINQSSSQVARETKVRRKLVKERSRLKRATVRNPNAKIIVNRGDLPVIKLGSGCWAVVRTAYLKPVSIGISGHSFSD